MNLRGAIRWWPVLFAVHSIGGAWFTIAEDGDQWWHWTSLSPLISTVLAFGWIASQRDWMMRALPVAVALAAIARLVFIVGQPGRTVAANAYAAAAQLVIVGSAAVLASATLATRHYFDHVKGGRREVAD